MKLRLLAFNRDPIHNRRAISPLSRATAQERMHAGICRRVLDDVLWRPSSDGHPSVQWLQTLWDRISEDPDGAAAVRGWPLLPVFGGKLVRVGAAVVEEGSWSAGVGAALAKLSCRVLDTSIITLDVAKVRCCRRGDPAGSCVGGRASSGA